MGMEFYNNYLSNVAQKPKDSHKQLIQETINRLWEDTDRIYTVKEQTAYPFTTQYTEYEAWLATVSDTTTAVNKNIADFVQVWFKDCNHPVNFKGQYYKFSLDGIHLENYICYDKMNELSQTSNFKVVRCNNVLTWIDKTNGNINTLPCYLGTDISSTNNQYTKDGTIPNTRMVIFVQANDYTLSIVKNQRFMFQHRSVFKVEEVDNYMQEQFTDGNVTYVKLYVAWSPVLPSDNTTNNICDYYNYQYSLVINQSSPINQITGFTTQLTATVYLDNNVVDTGVIWSSSDETVANIDSNGNLILVGSTGKSAVITCTIDGNDSISKTLVVNIIDSPSGTKQIVVSPTKDITLLTGQSQQYTAGVYLNNVLQSDVVICTPNWTGSNYTLVNNKVTCKAQSSQTLILTFSSGSLTTVNVNIKLGGIL